MKKIIAIILTAAMLFSLCAPAVYAEGADDEGCDCGVLPTIYVGPLGNTDIYAYPDMSG